MVQTDPNTEAFGEAPGEAPDDAASVQQPDPQPQPRQRDPNWDVTDPIEDFETDDPDENRIVVTLLRNEFIPPIDTEGRITHRDDGKFLAGDEVALPEKTARRYVRAGVAGVNGQARRFGAYMRARRQTIEDFYGNGEDPMSAESFGPWSEAHAPGAYPVKGVPTRMQQFGSRADYEATPTSDGALFVNPYARATGYGPGRQPQPLMDPTPADVDYTGSAEGAQQARPYPARNPEYANVVGAAPDARQQAAVFARRNTTVTQGRPIKRAGPPRGAQRGNGPDPRDDD